MTPGVIVAGVDVGSLANIGWWVIDEERETGGTKIDELIERVVGGLATGHKVALGFEAPLWVAIPQHAAELGKARSGEGNRPWSASAGATVLACGLQQSAFVLCEIAQRATQPPRVTLNMDDLMSNHSDLALWEAFVSAAAKDRAAPDPHVSDARAATREFARRWVTGTVRSDIEIPQRSISIAGLALLASGLSSDLSLATRPCTVVKAPVIQT